MISLYLNAGDNQVTYNKKHYLLRAAKRLGLEDYVLDYKPEYGVVEHLLNIEPFVHFKLGSRWTGVWEIDTMLDRMEMNMDTWVRCDTVFVAHSCVPERMNAFQGEKVILFQACDPELHRRLRDVTPEYDFVFAGSVGLPVYAERERTMDVLRNAGFTFLGHGKGFTPQEYVRRMNQGRVMFIRSGAKEPFTTQVEQRFFECLAIGPVLKDYHPDLETLGLVEGQDFYWYKNDEEMISKMKYLTANLDFARNMSENGRKKAIMYHTYEHRLMSIFNYIHEHVGY